MNKKFPVFLLYLFLIGAFYNLWTIRPVNILYIYSNEGVTVTIVVDHMPWTDREKIAWYLARRDEFKRKYPSFDNTWQTYYITDISDGYTNYEKSPHEDLFCIPTIKSDDNCLIKNYFLIVDEYTNTGLRFFPDSEVEYQLTPDNKIERVYQPEYLEK